MKRLQFKAKLYLSVFDCGLVSKWDHPLPRTRQFIAHEGCPVTITLTDAQLAQIAQAQARAAKVTGWKGKVKVR